MSNEQELDKVFKALDCIEQYVKILRDVNQICMTAMKIIADDNCKVSAKLIATTAIGEIGGYSKEMLAAIDAMDKALEGLKNET